MCQCVRERIRGADFALNRWSGVRRRMRVDGQAAQGAKGTIACDLSGGRGWVWPHSVGGLNECLLRAECSLSVFTQRREVAPPPAPAALFAMCVCRQATSRMKSHVYAFS